MRTRIAHRASACIGALAAAAAASAAPPAAAPVLLDELRLAEQVYALRPDLAIGNPTILVVRDGRDAVLIDAGIPENGPVLRSWLADHGIDRVRYLIFSHDHTDHVWGAQTFVADAPTVIATAEQAARLTAGPLHGTNDTLDRRVHPALWVDDQLVLKAGSQTLRILRPPYRRSHTDGDLFVRIEPADVIYAGDHLFADRFPVIDRESGGDLWGYLANVEWLAIQMRESTRWIAGHAAFAPAEFTTYSRAEVSAWVTLLRASIAEIAQTRASGVGLEAAQARGLSARFSSLGERPRFVKPEAWIETVYRALEDCDHRPREIRGSAVPACGAAPARR